MRNMKSILIVGLMLTPFASFAKGDAVARSAPFASDESIKYLSRKDKGIAFGRNKNFEGILVREENTSGELFYVDLYKFPKKDKPVIAIDEAACHRAAEAVIGTLEDDAYEAGKVDYYDNRYGRVCEFQVLNKMSGSTIREYRFEVAMIHGKAHIFVGKFTQKAKDEEVQELRDFVKSLYSSKGSAKNETKESKRSPASEPAILKK